ncbi:hypothetical protein [Aquabacterium sp. OR-4]|uniref:hypothetical protein n=1 Tax=Aquabacterium sp. OR-4 TaxID=2978127 RepID=UPI0028C5EC68|nr:hypothetical protein [Aquabacterium sp. OR-4]MDT7833772.1 hypothetical protein [Aquabacterium sp. OR-4]
MGATMSSDSSRSPASRPRPMRPGSGSLRALDAVLQSVESVRNGGALYLLLLSFALAGWLLVSAQRLLGGESWWPGGALAAAAFLVVLYGSTAAGLVLMDEALGRVPRHPLDALRAAPAPAHRLLAVVLTVLLLAAVLLVATAGLLWLARLPGVGAAWLGLLVPVVVPVLGLVALVMVTLVGPIAAPAAWFGLRWRQILALLMRQLQVRPVHAVLLSAAVSLLSAAVAGLISFMVLAGGRAFAALAAGLLGLPLAVPPFLSALFGMGLRVAPGAAPLPEHTSAAITGAGLVFALGLVVPGAVYLRGLCELFLALRGADAGADADADLEADAARSAPVADPGASPATAAPD